MLWTESTSPFWPLCRTMLGSATRSWPRGSAWRPRAACERVRALTRAACCGATTREVVARGARHRRSRRSWRCGWSKHARQTFRALYAHLLSLPEVLAVFHVSGLNDLQVHVAVRDIEHLRDLIVEQVAGRPEVGHCETSVMFDVYRKHQWPSYTSPAVTPASSRRRRAR